MKKRAIFILIFTLFAIQSYSQSFSNVDTINVVLSASSFKTVTLATGVKCITVDNSAESLDLKIGFSPYGSTVDTLNTYTVPAGETWSFPNRLNNYLFLKSGAVATIRLIIDYGGQLPYYRQSGVKIIADSLNVYLSPTAIASIKFRDTITYRDTLTETTPFKSYNFGSQYELITVTLTKNDTCAVVWDSVKFYSVSSYGDTALTGVRYTETFTDSTFVRVNWVAGTRTSSKKVLFLDPICKIMHIRLENYALTNRSVILTIRGAKK